jgi:hypothetical protein
LNKQFSLAKLNQARTQGNQILRVGVIFSKVDTKAEESGAQGAQIVRVELLSLQF